ncbi:gas vesicle accessory protein GvpU [Burkholderia pseudomultivorans]|uniref:gas vesicle accessory protein GvpU n=1 Tax=Burkholderia pseudomultivorans TaxID=1207504 RepID=UPI000AD3831C|nr:gas vesicle accessory protein GvpU [Burkholderia pseudomultivorans]
MTDTSPDNSKSDINNPQQPYATTDWFLQSLVSIVNRTPGTFGITLNVDGQLISGQLVGGKQYFEGFADAFAGALNDVDGAEGVRSFLASHGNIYSDEDDAPNDIPPPQFIHVKGARFFSNSGNPIPGNGGVWWRGRISEVDGFCLGELSAS